MKKNSERYSNEPDFKAILSFPDHATAVRAANIHQRYYLRKFMDHIETDDASPEFSPLTYTADLTPPLTGFSAFFDRTTSINLYTKHLAEFGIVITSLTVRERDIERGESFWRTCSRSWNTAFKNSYDKHFDEFNGPGGS